MLYEYVYFWIDNNIRFIMERTEHMEIYSPEGFRFHVSMTKERKEKLLQAVASGECKDLWEAASKYPDKHQSSPENPSPIE